MARESIKKMLTSKEEPERKSVTISLDASMLNQVDRIAKAFSIVNDAKNFSRNAIIEAAIKDFIEDSEQILFDEHGIDVNDDDVFDEVVTLNYDLAIFPAHNEGFEEAFLKEKSWYAVRIKEERIPNIKYVACYRARPFSGITHYAKVKEIKQYLDTDKKIIIFDGDPIELPQIIKLGETNANAMRSPRYTTLTRLKNAREVKELF